MTSLRHLRSALLALAVAFPCAAKAQAPRPEQPLAVRVNSELGGAITGLFQSYREDFGSVPNYDHESGWTAGFGLKATQLFEAFGVDHLYAGLHYNFNDGTTDYHGNTVNTFIPLHLSVGEIIHDVNLELGKGFLIHENLLLIPVVQLDYRSWQRSVPNGFSVEETYSYIAPGLALRVTYALTDALALTGKLGWEYTIAPTTDATGNPTINTPSASLKLGNRSIWQLAAGLDYALTRRLHATAEAQYQHLDFGRSQIAFYKTPTGPAGIFEPPSHTNTLLLQLGLAWSF